MRGPEEWPSSPGLPGRTEFGLQVRLPTNLRFNHFKALKRILGKACRWQDLMDSCLQSAALLEVVFFA